MNPFRHLEVAAAGLVTPVGLTAPSSAAALRAGISRLSESQIYGHKGEPLVMGLVRDEHLPPLARSVRTHVGLMGRQGRLLRLAAPAIQEACTRLKLAEPPPLLLALPDSSHPGAQHIGPALLDLLAIQAGVALDLQRSRIIQQGRAGGLVAIQQALALHTKLHVPYVLVGGVDTYLERSLLKELGQTERLHTRGLSDGFVPGEAAAFLLLRLAPKRRGDSIVPLAQISALGTGVEPGHMHSEKPYLGTGLAAAFQELFASLPPDSPKVSCVYAGLNGERFWAKEWGVAFLRSRERFKEQCPIEHPIEYIGDPGAALGPLMLGLAAIGIHRGYRPSPCLVWCSSDNEERAAVLVQQAQV